MNNHKLTLFLGKPIKITEAVGIHSPTINEIDDISENGYNLHLVFSTFDKKTIYKYFFEGVTDEMLDQLDEHDSYDLLVTENPYEFIIGAICDAFKFFTKKTVTFRDSIFYIDDYPLIHKDNYKEIVECVRLSTCTEESKEEKIKFKNDRVKQKYKKMQELKRKYNVENNLGLKDIASILCAAEGNGIDIFNVGNLTIYQLYEQFERLGIKESYTRTLMLWANTYNLGENGKLQEWMVKSKL